MPCPLLISSQSDYLILVFDRNSHIKWKTVQIQISWLLQKPTDLDLHSLLRQGMSCSARDGLKNNMFMLRKTCYFFHVVFMCTAIYMKSIGTLDISDKNLLGPQKNLTIVRQTLKRFHVLWHCVNVGCANLNFVKGCIRECDTCGREIWQSIFILFSVIKIWLVWLQSICYNYSAILL